MAGNIFISYRRDDSKHAAGRLVDRLQAEFDQDQLFLDVDNIELGLDFVEVINERVAACDIMLVVIGPNWLNSTDDDGRRRLDDPQDFLRLEIEAALERNIRVVPILVDGAAPIRAEDLPASIAPLANRQATRLAHETFSSDAGRLTQALVQIVSPAETSRPPNEPKASQTAPETSPQHDGKTEHEPPETGTLRSSRTSQARRDPNPSTGGDNKKLAGSVLLIGSAAAALLAAIVGVSMLFATRIGLGGLLMVFLIFFGISSAPVGIPGRVPRVAVAGLIAFTVFFVLAVLL